jgi:hypothetical protein
MHRAAVLACGPTVTTNDLPPHLGDLKAEETTAEGGSLVARSLVLVICA